MLAFRLRGLSGNRQSLYGIAEYFLPWVWSALVFLMGTGFRRRCVSIRLNA